MPNKKIPTTKSVKVTLRLRLAEFPLWGHLSIL